jgi:release factor glutamine methyltransferase
LSSTLDRDMTLPMKRIDLLRNIRAVLAQPAGPSAGSTGLDDPVREARLIVSHAAGVSAADLLAHPDMDVASDAADRALAIALDRARGCPLSRIIGAREFYGLSFALTPDTLDPRPETEMIVDHALAFLNTLPETGPIEGLDLGTGTGCIPIALLTHCPRLRMTASDISPGAIQAARDNADTHGVSDRLSLCVSDWYQTIAVPSGGFDIVISNPPYIPFGDVAGLTPEVRDHDPIRALSAGDSGLEAYDSLFSGLSRVINATGRTFFEIGIGQAGDLTKMAEKYGLDVRRILHDYADIPRVMEISRAPDEKVS